MSRKIAWLLLFILTAQETWACPFCNPEIKNAIYDSRFLPNLLVMLSAFFALGLIVAGLAFISARRHKAQRERHPAGEHLSPVPLLTTALILGIGVGGFIDGIVFHQILQWHSMLSNRVPATDYVGKSVNMFWDGIFHAFTFLVTLVGIIRLWKLLWRKDIVRSGYLLSGGLVTGWGIFNMVEGIIDHQVLKLHNVRELSNNPERWNLGFLGFSVLLILGGYLLTAKRKQPAAEI
ncbi:MAG TPA: DUF2243 domain-containing protein [Flavisolibacter sp.]|nr:DUF2243 domain-containing protein [Flavisolibacter sp.]